MGVTVTFGRRASLCSILATHTNGHEWEFPKMSRLNLARQDEGSDTIDTQDKVMCNENMNYAMIQNKEEG